MREHKKTHRLLAIGAAMGLIVVSTGGGLARPPSDLRPLPSTAFRPLFAPRPADQRISEPVQVPPVVDVLPEPARPTLRPAQSKIQPQTPPKVRAEIPSRPPRTGGLKGVASWYCLSGVSRCTRNHPGGMYAAIRRDLLHLRGQKVDVCTAARCIEVTIIDCNCGPNANLIDLYADAFRRLAPLSAGVVRVTVRP